MQDHRRLGVRQLIWVRKGRRPLRMETEGQGVGGPADEHECSVRAL
jgi:hypothetical protein